MKGLALIVAMVLLSGVTGARAMGGEPREGMLARQAGGEWRWGRDSAGVEIDTVEVVNMALDSMLAANEGKMSRQERRLARRQGEKPHSPTKATWLAMVLPGAGQVYNRQWWKLPILYGGVGATVYGLSWNMKYYKRYRTAFADYTAYLNQIAEDRENDRETPYPADNSWDKLMAPGRTAEGYSESMQQRFQEVLKTKKDNYKRNRDLLYIVSGGIYVIQIIDAVVFAHFYDFEINEDLSMRLEPSTGFSPVCGGTVGLTLTFNF